MAIHTVRGISLFSGVGMLDEGIRAGFEHLGIRYRTVCYCERESYAASVLMARMEDEALERAPICDSLEDIDGRWRGKVDCVVAGFPCQPFSLAGARNGTADERWLWADIIRIVREVGPEFVFLENVPGLLTGDGGRAFGAILDSLAEMGFHAEWCHITASSVGASHKRERWFCLAYRSGGGAGESRRPLTRQSEQQPGRAVQSGGYGGSVAYRDSGKLRKQSGRCGGEVGPGAAESSEHGPELANDSGERSGARGAECTGQQRSPSPEQRGGELGNAAGTRYDDPWGGAELREQRGGECLPGTGCGELGDTSSEGFPQRGEAEGTNQQQALVGAGVGNFAPGPSDSGWQPILSEFPHLSPAIKPGIRQLVDGQSLVVDASRADQLRCTGNQVVAIQAAAAFVELMRRAELA